MWLESLDKFLEYRAPFSGTAGLRRNVASAPQCCQNSKRHHLPGLSMDAGLLQPMGFPLGPAHVRKALFQRITKNYCFLFILSVRSRFIEFSIAIDVSAQLKTEQTTLIVEFSSGKCT